MTQDTANRPSIDLVKERRNGSLFLRAADTPHNTALAFRADDGSLDNLLRRITDWLIKEGCRATLMGSEILIDRVSPKAAVVLNEWNLHDLIKNVSPEKLRSAADAASAESNKQIMRMRVNDALFHGKFSVSEGVRGQFNLELKDKTLPHRQRQTVVEEMAETLCRAYGIPKNDVNTSRERLVVKTTNEELLGDFRGIIQAQSANRVR